MPTVLDQLLSELQSLSGTKTTRAGVKHDVSGVPTTTYIHGPGGLLSFPGVNNDVFHSMVGSRSMLSMIPARSTVQNSPIYAVITGVTADSGSEPDAPCDEAPVAGDMKACYMTSVFGRYERQTQQIEINRLGLVNDRADPMDLTLIGSPVDGDMPFPGGMLDSGVPGDVLRNELAVKLWTRNVAFYRLISKQLWQGHPVNNTGAGGYREVTGLETLINTGHVDAETGAACASLDPYIVDFNGRLDATGTQIVATVTNMMYQLRDRAERGGMEGVRWVAAMRSQLFYELTAIWPCSYLTYRCMVTNNNGERVNIDARDATQLRDDMRAGKYLLIDGERLDVVFDDGITENSTTGPAGCFETDIFIIPMGWAGRSLTYLEYFQYDNAAARALLGNRWVLAEVDGAFLSWPKQTNECIQIQSKIEPRVVLRTPWLAGRITDVRYCPIQHTRDAFPEDPYHTDGGKLNRGTGPSYFKLWQS